MAKKETVKKINLKPIVESAMSYLALVILAGLAYKGVESMVNGSEVVCTAIAVLTVVLLLKTAIKR